MSGTKDAQRDSSASLTPPDIPQSQLDRMDPDSILADDADPDGVLGNDSESDAGISSGGAVGAPMSDGKSSKRTSAASAIFDNEADKDRNSLVQPLPPSTPDLNGDLASPLQTPKPKTDPVPEDPQVTIKKLEEQVADLTNQVTGLNNKLVKSFERMADLEDDLSESQDRVHVMSKQITELEKEREEHLAALNTGLLVEKAHVSTEMQRMMDRVIEETAQRGKAESDKKRIEEELDELSSSLFNEANKMVAVERLARARAEEKSKQMEERLKDTEGIMVEQQKILADLQRQVEKQSASRKADDAESVRSFESDAVSFVRLKPSSLARSISQRTTAKRINHMPGPPLGAEARLLINIVPYQEYKSFISHLRKLRKQLSPFYNYPYNGSSKNGTEASAGSGQITPRTPSPAPNQNGAIQPSIVGLTGAGAYSQGLAGAAYTVSPFAAAGVGRHRDYPLLPSNAETLVHLPSQLSLPFIKRAQEEDVDPCLRLDFAPGLNWLSRRQANTAILEGNLVIEPLFPGGKVPNENAIRQENAHLPPAACALCGIAVVNVPLPGGVAASPMAAEQGGKTSLVPASIANATTSWASSAANSLREVTGGGTSGSGTLTPKSSRPGLFSSFRRSAGRNSTGSLVTSEPESPSNSTNPTGATAEESESRPLPLPALDEAALPLPTHIFRISEGATTRYLLCPHHCLNRLRAACEFWGFIRTLERSIVLEGKFVVDEARTDPHHRSATSTPVPVTKTEETPVTKTEETGETDGEKKDVSQERAGDADANSQKDTVGEPEHDDQGKKEDGAGSDKQDTAEATESVAGEAQADVNGEDASGDAETGDKEPLESSGDEAKESAETKDEGDDRASDDEDGFADAISSSPASRKEELAAAANEIQETDETSEDQAATPLAHSVAHLEEEAAKADLTPTSKDEPEEAQDAQQTTTDAQSSIASSSNVAADATQEGSNESVARPPLPQRSAARGSGAQSPVSGAPAGPVAPATSAPPALPPRRVVRPVAKVADAMPAPTAARTSLSLVADDSFDWEDKMWTEITKLKESLWKARIGLLAEEADI